LNIPFDSSLNNVLKNRGLDYLSSNQVSETIKDIPKQNQIINNNNQNININGKNDITREPMTHIIHPFVKRHVIKNIRKSLIGQSIKVGGWQKTLRQSGDAF